MVLVVIVQSLSFHVKKGKQTYIPSSGNLWKNFHSWHRSIHKHSRFAIQTWLVKLSKWLLGILWRLQDISAISRGAWVFWD